MDERLRTMRTEGMSFRPIAMVLGVSRSAIAGRARRLGLSLTNSRNTQPKAVLARPEPLPTPETPMPQPEPENPLIRLLDAGINQCRWIVELSPTPTVCGAQTIGHNSWCPSHLKLVYPPQPKKREAVNA